MSTLELIENTDKLIQETQETISRIQELQDKMKQDEKDHLASILEHAKNVARLFGVLPC